MRNKMILLAVFALGVAIGSGATFKYAKDKYAKIAQEEIDSVKAVFSKKKDSDDKPDESDTDKAVMVEECEKVITNNGYAKYSNVKSREEKAVDGPYVIPPDEYDEFEDYEAISLTYYSDGFLADDMDELVEDIEGTIGFQSLEHFGEYEDDTVVVRNDALKCDYEICMDTRKYRDIIGD